MRATWGHAYWTVFLLVTSALLIPAELYAVVTRPANTLSDFSWYELGVYPGEKFFAHNAAWFLSQGVFLVLTLWLWAHIWYGEFK